MVFRSQYERYQLFYFPRGQTKKWVLKALLGLEMATTKCEKKQLRAEVAEN